MPRATPTHGAAFARLPDDQRSPRHLLLKSIAKYEVFLEQYPEHLPALDGLAYLYLRLGTCEVHPDKLGGTWDDIRLGRARALQVERRRLALSPHDLPVWQGHLLGLSTLSTSGKTEVVNHAFGGAEAAFAGYHLEVLNHTLGLATSAGQVREAARLLWDRAWLSLEAGQHQAAYADLMAYRSHAGLDPACEASTWLGLSRCAGALGWPQEALDLFDRADWLFREGPTVVGVDDLRYAERLSLLQSLGRQAEANEMLTRALNHLDQQMAANESSDQHWRKVGWLRAAGRTPEAEAALQALIAFAPQYRAKAEQEIVELSQA